MFGFARNERLRQIIEPQMQQAAALYQQTGQAARVFTEFAYQTNTIAGAGRGAWWPRPSRSKAKRIHAMWSPRWLLTAGRPQKLYEELYCARGDMENRIKEQYSLFAGRVSAATMRANQLRLYLSAAAYVLLTAFRRLALAGTGLGASTMPHHPLAACCAWALRCASLLARCGFRWPAATRTGACSITPISNSAR